MSGDAQGTDAATGRLRTLAGHPVAMLLLYGAMAGAAFSISKLAMGAATELFNEELPLSGKDKRALIEYLKYF